jgi:hypothetical protein
MHIFGLLHTHQNYDQSPGFNVKRDICEQACVETTPSMVAGDFCDDTPPTPENRLCQDPEPCSQTAKGQWCSDCQSRVWRGTNFANVMGYAPDECIYGAAVAAFRARGNNSRSTGYQVRILESGIQNGYLTPLQAARARCFYDARWTNLWALQKAPSVVPVPPTRLGRRRRPRRPDDRVALSGLSRQRLARFRSRLSASRRSRSAAAPSTCRVCAERPAVGADRAAEGAARRRLFLHRLQDRRCAAQLWPLPRQDGRRRSRIATACAPAPRAIVSLSWSDWSEHGRADGGGGCPGNCNGHGTCNNGACQCNAGWSKRDPLCRWRTSAPVARAPAAW